MPRHVKQSLPWVVGQFKGNLMSDRRKIKSDHLKGLRRLKEEIGSNTPRILICLEPFRRITDDGILFLPYQEFINDLWQG